MTIAARAGVGRTVVRGLLRHLGRKGFLTRCRRQWVVRRPLPLPPEGRSAPRSKKDWVKEDLLAALTGGRLRPGHRVVELAVARRLGVSTAVVREALLELLPLGAFVKKERSHWQVASVDDKQLEALREFREMVEVFALRRLLARSRVTPVPAFARNRRRTEALLASPRVTTRDILEVDLEFHRLLLESSGNPLLLERAGFIYLIIEFQLVSPHFQLERGKLGLRQHLRIHRAIARGRPGAAEKALRQHLRAANESICAIARSLPSK
jgi:DNA-binding GntR family transcriptional regulator